MQIAGIILCVTFASLSLWKLINPLGRKPPLGYDRSDNNTRSNTRSNTLKHDKTM